MQQWLARTCCCVHRDERTDLLIEAPAPPVAWQRNFSGLSRLSERGAAIAGSSGDDARDEEFWRRPIVSRDFFPRLADWALEPAELSQIEEAAATMSDASETLNRYSSRSRASSRNSLAGLPAPVAPPPTSPSQDLRIVNASWGKRDSALALMESISSVELSPSTDESSYRPRFSAGDYVSNAPSDASVTDASADAPSADDFSDSAPSVGDEGVVAADLVVEGIGMLVAKKAKFHFVMGFWLRVGAAEVELVRRSERRVYRACAVTRWFYGRGALARRLLAQPPFRREQFAGLDLAALEPRSCVFFVAGRQVPYVPVFASEQALESFVARFAAFVQVPPEPCT